MDLVQETAIREDLLGLADRGVTITALDAKLRDYRLNDEEYDELWLYAWSLLERHAARAIADPEGSFGYGQVDGG